MILKHNPPTPTKLTSCLSSAAGARGRRVQVAAEHAELPPREHHRQAVGRARAHHHRARRRQERGLLPEERLAQMS